jgi:hypothetical protein
MPAQTTNLFLLEELEDVGRTSELAQSDLDVIGPRLLVHRIWPPVLDLVM